jgi:hypothetical protein
MTTLVYNRQMQQTEICDNEFWGLCKKVVSFEGGDCLFKGHVD